MSVYSKHFVKYEVCITFLLCTIHIHTHIHMYNLQMVTVAVKLKGAFSLEGKL